MRFTFGGAASDFAIQAPSLTGDVVHAAPNRTGGTAWTARTGGTQYTDLVAVPGNPAPVSSDANGWINQFQGPDGVIELWVDLGTGVRFLLETVDPIPFIRYDISQTLTPTEQQQVRDTLGIVDTNADVDYYFPADYGAAGTGAVDDTAALNACFAAAKATGGVVFMGGRDKQYLINGEVVQGNDTFALGGGGQRRDTSCAVIMGSSSAMWRCGKWSTGDSRPLGMQGINFDVHGSGSASGRLVVQAVTTSIQNVTMTDTTALSLAVSGLAPGDGVVFDEAQNIKVIGLDVELVRGAALVLDNGAGGLSFDRCHPSHAGTLVKITHHSSSGGYPFGPSNNYFNDCIFETNMSSIDYVLLAKAGSMNVFTNCGYSVNTSTATINNPELVRVDNTIFPTITTHVAFEGGTWYGGKTSSKANGVGIYGSNKVSLGGHVFLQKLATWVKAMSGAPTVQEVGIYIDPAWPATNVDALYAKDASAQIFNFYSVDNMMRVAQLSADFAAAYEIFALGEAQPRQALMRNGSHLFGGGSVYPAVGHAYSPTVSGTATIGTFQIRDRWVRLGGAALPGANAALTIDASACNIYEVGFASSSSSVTGVTITNPQDGSMMTISYFQPSSGGAAYAWPSNAVFKGPTPTSTAPSEITSVTFRYNAAGSIWVETWRNGARQTDLPSYIT